MAVFALYGVNVIRNCLTGHNIHDNWASLRHKLGHRRCTTGVLKCTGGSRAEVRWSACVLTLELATWFTVLEEMSSKEASLLPFSQGKRRSPPVHPDGVYLLWRARELLSMHRLPATMTVRRMTLFLPAA